MLIPMLSIGVAGLGACSVTPLTQDQIYQVAESAGFASGDIDGSIPGSATQMTAIAMRESGGCPTAYNGGNPPGKESSYGLWQINIAPGGSPNLPAQMGITADQLFDPATNAAAAMRLYGGNPANLNTAWYINQPGYQQAFLAQLPGAIAAEGVVDAGGGLDAPGAGDSSGQETVAFGLTSTQLAIGAGILAALAIVAMV